MVSLSTDSLFGVKGHVAVVTGGSSGLGFMICKVRVVFFFCRLRGRSRVQLLTWLKGLVTNGAKVYLVALPSEPIEERVAELNALGASCGSGGSGGSAQGYGCDVSSKEAIAGLAAHIGERETYLDMLISNAGIRRDPPEACNVLTAPLAELQASMWSSRHGDWADTFAVNTTAHYFLSVALLPLLAAASARDLGHGRTGRSDGRGVVVITSSCASMHNVTNVDLTSYASSKAATDHLVRLLAAKFGRFYVRVAGINPGCEALPLQCSKPVYTANIANKQSSRAT